MFVVVVHYDDDDDDDYDVSGGGMSNVGLSSVRSVCHQRRR